MKATAPTTMSLGIIDRRNGAVQTSVPFPDHENPLILPHPETFIWHYMHFEHFPALLESRSLYFRRLDEQSDETDGQFAAINALKTTPVMQQLAAKCGIIKMENGAALFQTNGILRRKAFIHCWSTGTNDSAWMWNTRTSHRSIAIRTTVARLRRAVDAASVEMGRVIYYSAEKPRPDWSHTASFWAKSQQFKRERELRMAHILTIGDQTEAHFKLVPFDLSAFLKIVVHPQCEDGFADDVRCVLAKFGLRVAVRKSKLRPADLRACPNQIRGLQDLTGAPNASQTR